MNKTLLTALFLLINIVSQAQDTVKARIFVKEKNIKRSFVYAEAGGIMLTGGTKAPYVNGWSFSLGSASVIFKKHLLVDFCFDADILMNAQKDLFAAAYKVTPQEITRIKNGFAGNFTLALMPVFANTRNFSVAAGPSASFKMLGIPGIETTYFNYEPLIADKFLISWGFEAVAYVKKSLKLYVDYSNAKGGVLQIRSPEGVQIPVDLSLVRVGLGYRFHSAAKEAKYSW